MRSPHVDQNASFLAAGETGARGDWNWLEFDHLIGRQRRKKRAEVIVYPSSGLAGKSERGKERERERCDCPRLFQWPYDVPATLCSADEIYSLVYRPGLRFD
ncbi:hypothetical protein DPEC_G00276760 [Dallia pectoralis]|uniref:Uncharacterized protein n=1 Tax=Dallia pectoralis TaxID=75939 RepID=A0ACC2FLL9_DALPE|nr:hypothetical protein DPEC_G00276760 [Dallia pectoralis]